MRGAAAALAGAVLFFLGVLTAASDTERIAPPPLIPLGVDVAGRPAASQTSGDEAPPAPAVPGADAATPPAATAVPADPSAPPAGEEPRPARGSGGVEEVHGELDCYEVGTDDADQHCPPGRGRQIDDPAKDKGHGDGRQ
jgi:hypothetical protein